MPENVRYFLGYGERLTERVPPPGGGGGSDPAYTLQEAVARLAPMLSLTTAAFADLPDAACPDDQAVGVVTLHPQWMAKTSHPQQLLNQYDLRQVGSRPVTVQPEATTKKTAPTPDASSELYVAGSRDAFRAWSRDLQEHPAIVHEQVRRIEAVRAPEPADRLRNVSTRDDAGSSEALLLEVVLHASESRSDSYIVAGFAAYAESIGAHPELGRRLHAGGLCFLPVEAPVDVIDELVEFAFLRVARPMPRLRIQPSFERSLPAPGLTPCPLPTESAVDADLRIAVFDGGLASTSPLLAWATPHEPPGIGAGDNRNLAHGHDVTSALLFGSLVPGQPAPRPYGVVDHYRVIDKDAENDPYELYEVLRRVDDVLKSRKHEFFNLSIGPVLPVEDDEVHPWTALLDAHLSDGNSLASLAIGNTGDLFPSPESRIQVPADCVNGLSVGAADSQRLGWSRAPYSSLGPGRSPGVIKPDVVAFGGTDTEPFLVYDSGNAPSLSQTRGTSFASPAALRLAAGVRAHFGDRVTALGLKALLVHSAQDGGNDRDEVGWGRIPAQVTDIAICTDGMVRVIYQGELSPSQYVRAAIPLPDEPLKGMVAIESTFCYATPTEPQDPGAYTTSGLEVTFRPHSGRYSSDEATVPKSVSFFKKSAIATEQSLRNDAHKWETTLHARQRFQARSLLNPVFDIHYNARNSGGAAKDADKIRYAMVLTVTAPRVADLYDQVVRAYAGRLEALTPVVEIPIRV
jgi:hypothetical protein